MNARSLGLIIVATLAGVAIGLVVGYIPSLLVYGLVAGATQGTISQTGGWAEAGAIGGVVWLAAAGLIVGLVQQRALPASARSIWWVVALAVIWAAAHIVNMLLRGLAGDVDLSSLLPALVLISVGVGIALLGRGSRSSRP